LSESAFETFELVSKEHTHMLKKKP
jgi:hypothetical protein